MKAFIFDPLWHKLVDKKMEEKLQNTGIETIVISTVKPLSETKELFTGTEERLLCLNPDYVGWKLANEDYKNIPNLKAILIASTGFEWVERQSAKELGIPVCQIVNFSTQAVAEWAFTIMLNLARQVPKLIKDDFPLDYDKDFMKYRGVQLKGKKAGIIGLGNIGSSIAELCKGIGMDVQYWSRSSANASYNKTSLDKLMATSDVIFPAVAKNEETLKLINDELIRSMKSTAILIDIAHGLFNEKLVLEMVSKGNLFGYGFEGKPNKFSTYEGNVWAAPAYAWATYESMYNSELKLVENIVNASKGKFPYRVN